ncbi:MAG: hypothetical protein KC933_00275 [Myxococcales bacterium]|nr:hypothetical protein [Myxococcales bacterium]MCB9649558.1 hypothetical protein [Deltaproteobacteria bacterium]
MLHPLSERPLLLTELEGEEHPLSNRHAEDASALFGPALRLARRRSADG